MSAVCVFTPVAVELAWPVLQMALGAAMTSLGYQVVDSAAATKTDAQANTAEVELEMERTHGLDETMGTGEAFTARKGEVTLTFHKSADGRLKVCASGKGVSAHELKAAGEEALGAFMQAYVRQKIADELKKRGYSTEEERLEDGSIRLKAKHWEGGAA